MAVPGWPLPAFWTASAARHRTVSTARTSRSVHPARVAIGAASDVSRLVLVAAWLTSEMLRSVTDRAYPEKDKACAGAETLHIGPTKLDSCWSIGAPSRWVRVRSTPHPQGRRDCTRAAFGSWIDRVASPGLAPDRGALCRPDQAANHRASPGDDVPHDVPGSAGVAFAVADRGDPGWWLSLIHISEPTR